MAFCSNCGEKLENGVKFCPNCGAAIGATGSTDQEKRKVTYAGNVRKCPSCGMELPSMVAICPECGYEINSQQIHPFVAELSDALKKCDQEIAAENSSNSDKKKQGWYSWDTWAKVGWVVLNIATLCIPHIIYCWKTGQPQTAASTRKAALIENFQVPNEKEALFEMLYLVQTMVGALSIREANENSLYWAKLWKLKAKYIYDKANVLLPGNETFAGTYKNIVARVGKIKRIFILKKIGIVLISLIVLSALVFSVKTYGGDILNTLDALEVSNVSNIPEKIVTINPPISADEIDNQHYQIIVTQFEDAGFTNVDTQKLEDLIIGFLVKDGSVDKVLINGDSSFSSSSSYDPDVKVTVIYHTFPAKDK